VVGNSKVERCVYRGFVGRRRAHSCQMVDMAAIIPYCVAVGAVVAHVCVLCHIWLSSSVGSNGVYPMYRESGYVSDHGL
jgi:hypothetical protein